MVWLFVERYAEPAAVSGRPTIAWICVVQRCVRASPAAATCRETVDGPRRCADCYL